MNILMIDKEGSTLDFALRAMYYGHKVRAAYAGAGCSIGKGLITLVDDFMPSAPWADLIFVSDNSWKNALVDRLIRQGYPVFGGTSRMSEWELDRGVGQAILKKHGVKTLPSEVFTSYDKAIAYVKKTLKRYVSKPEGDADKALSYVSKSPADMVYMLERWKRSNKLKGEFLLQAFTPGVEMAVGAFYANGERVSPWLENFEFKKLMNDDKGVATGEQGTVMRYVEKSKLADKVVKPVESAIEDYTGYLDVNCIIGEDGTPWPLEFTCRPGWPLFQIQMALHDFDMAQWMLDAMLQGTKMQPSRDVATGVVLSIPDYPYSKLTRKEVQGVPVYGMTARNRWSIHPAEMMLGSAPAMVDGKVQDQKMLVTAGDYVLITSGVGKDVATASKNAYDVMAQLEVPNSPMYRTDIGRRLKKQLPMLQKLGYAEGLNYGAPDDHTT